MESTVQFSDLHIRVDSEASKKALPILNEMGISASDLFNMLLNQVAIQRRVPFYLDCNEYTFSPSAEADFHTFESWEEAKEWLRA